MNQARLCLASQLCFYNHLCFNQSDKTKIFDVVEITCGNQKLNFSIIFFVQCEFAVNEVYAIDMLISTGDGKSRDMDFRTTIYKREPDQVYQLKMKASRGKR